MQAAATTSVEPCDEARAGAASSAHSSDADSEPAPWRSAVTDRTYSPSFTQQILASERENGDLVTDLTKFACQLALDRRRPVSVDAAAAPIRSEE